MTMLPWDMIPRPRETALEIEFHLTYGAAAKYMNRVLGVRKTHANDARAMGVLHPKHRTDTEYYQKLRRNDPILEKFYAAVYIVLRDGKEKRGAQLASGITRRSESRRGKNDERIHHGSKK